MTTPIAPNLALAAPNSARCANAVMCHVATPLCLLPDIEAMRQIERGPTSTPMKPPAL